MNQLAPNPSVKRTACKVRLRIPFALCTATADYNMRWAP